MKRCVLLAGLVASALCASQLDAQELAPIPKETAQAIAKRLVEEATKLQDPAVQIDAQPQEASGVRVPQELGMLVVPAKGVEENEAYTNQFHNDPGAPLGYLFMYKVLPFVDGKPIDPSKLYAIKFTDESGSERTMHALLLAIRQLSETDYRLYGYGAGRAPLVNAKFSEQARADAGRVAMKVVNLDHPSRQADVMIVVFGKYGAPVPMGAVR